MPAILYKCMNVTTKITRFITVNIRINFPQPLQTYTFLRMHRLLVLQTNIVRTLPETWEISMVRMCWHSRCGICLSPCRLYVTYYSMFSPMNRAGAYSLCSPWEYPSSTHHVSRLIKKHRNQAKSLPWMSKKTKPPLADKIPRRSYKYPRGLYSSIKLIYLECFCTDVTLHEYILLWLSLPS